ncbi:MAG: CHRD domain-containing protein [bacterium]
MNNISRKLLPVLLGVLGIVVVSGCASKAGMSDGKMGGMMDGGKHDMSAGKMGSMSDGNMMDGKMHGMSTLTLDGSQEVPPVDTAANGNGNVTVSTDKSVSGSIMTTGINGMAAHIHEGAAGANGAVIITLVKSTGGTWVVPIGAMLNDKQYASYMSGNLYVNIHSAAHPNGEIRAQLSPK